MQYSEEEKTLWLEDWRQSGKSAWAYAKENGLNPQTFGKWTKAKEESAHSFVELSPQALAVPQYNQEILIEKGDVKIHIPVFLSSVELRAIMEGLGRVL